MTDLDSPYLIVSFYSVYGTSFARIGPHFQVLFICMSVMFLNLAFQQKPLNRFIRFFASLTKNGGTFRTCYLRVFS